MEPPSSSQSDGLLPQDLSKCSLPCALNLTRKGEDNLLKTTSMEAFRVVKTPNWYNIGPGSNSKGLVFAENESDHASQPSQRVQSVDGFSNATVTLSYMSRSCLYSSPDSLSQLPSICGVSSLNGKLSQRSAPCETDTLTNQAGGGGLNVDIDQCILQHTPKPLALVSQTEVHETSAQTPLIESISGACFMPQILEVNGNKGTYPLGAQKLEPMLGDSPLECTHSQEKDGCVHNGITISYSDLGLCKETSRESPNSGNGGERKNCETDVVFLISETSEPVILLDNGGSRNLCHSSNGEYVSPLDDPLSPPATSLDETEDVFVLPQTLSSPTGDNLTDDASDITAEEEPGTHSAKEFPVEPVDVRSPAQSCLGNSNVVEMPVTSNGIQTLPADVPELCKPLSESDGLLESKTMSSGVQENKSLVRDDSVCNGDVVVQDWALQKKKLPPRSGRGTRLEAIVHNMSPSKCKVLTHVHSNKKCCSPKAHADEIHQEGLEVLQNQDSAEDVSGFEKQPSLKLTVLEKVNAINSDTDSNRSKTSTSDSENASPFKALYSNSCPEPLTHSKTEKEESNRCPPKRSSRSKGLEASPVSKQCQKSPAKQYTASLANRVIPATEKAQVTKRKRKKRKTGQSSLFSPQEPEIKLKYVNYKEEKRDVKADSFSPFIRMEVKEFSTCTVINYAEEENARLRKGQQPVTSGFISGIIPTTSCLQMGRVGSDSKCQSSLVCCLCGRSANALDLGDLHGPYYPEGHKPAPKALSSLQDMKEEDDSDSDSSCGAHGRKHAQAGHSWPQRPSHKLKREEVLGACRRWTADNEGLQSPSAKRPRTELVTDNWYSPPVVPLDTNEYWIHEDCGIWSAGVYLVKGKLYGLEEAVRLAQETDCSTCHRRGATLGCFFKGCPNKYHYTCALQSDCVLNEENFSMKCTKHKNKSFKGYSVNRQETR